MSKVRKTSVRNVIVRYMSEYLSEQDATTLEAWKEVEAAVFDAVEGLVVVDDSPIDLPIPPVNRTIADAS